MGLRFYLCYVDGRPFSHALAARCLRRRGVRECIFEQSLHPGRAFARRGITPVTREPLLRAVAAAFTLTEREKRKLQGAVAIYALSAAEVKDTVEKLLPHVRRISLGPMRGREELCREVLYEKGAVLDSADTEALAKAETLLLFSPPADLTAENALTLRLYGDAELSFRLREELEAQLPPGLPRLPLLAALYRAGVVNSEDIFPLCD